MACNKALDVPVLPPPQRFCTHTERAAEPAGGTLDAATRPAGAAAAQAVGEAYRYFRVVKTGPDAQGDDFLHISGIELYGHVRMCLDVRDPCA